ncbi:hypothetical protein [Extensimonas sp. H3M7-6]|uniref:hypothetical protein n=1 Tax=Extensimonas soli TaxID=3031322 RepID=UPI0023DA9276|nr:hypothetical protein [Extensimonas sp. H3M7-6]MDF1483425.1 hypothetical protein [Extensimonas sp. H3M7-6]
MSINVRRCCSEFVLAALLCGQVPLACASGPAQQAVSMPAEVEFDSNPELRPGSASSAVRYRLRPQYNYTYHVDDTNEWSAVLGANLERSSNTQVSANRQDPSVELKWLQKAPTSLWELNAKYSKASTRTTEFDQTGIVTADRTQTNRSVGANWGKYLTERWMANGGISQQWVDYDTNTLVSYRNSLASGGLSYDLAASQKMSIFFAGSHYSPYANNFVLARSSSGMGLVFGYVGALSDKIDLNVQAGKVKITGLDAGYYLQGKMEVNYKGNYMSGGASFDRSAVAGGQTGGLTISNSLRLQTRIEVAERTAVDFYYTFTKNAGFNGGKTNSMGAKYLFQISPLWSLNFNVQRRTADQRTGYAGANLVGVGLNYSHSDF